MSTSSADASSIPQVDPEGGAPSKERSVHSSNGSPVRYHNPFASCFSRGRWHDDRYEHFISESLAEFPEGYPRLAAYTNSDLDTMLFRRFGWLRCRALLHIQDELHVLEDELKALDAEHARGHPDRLRSRRFDEDQAYHQDIGMRRAIMVDINSKLKDYDNLLERQRFVSTIRNPSMREFRSHFDWIRNHTPVVWEESQFIYHKDDILSLGQQSDTWLGPLTDCLLQLLPSILAKVCIHSYLAVAQGADAKVLTLDCTAIFNIQRNKSEAQGSLHNALFKREMGHSGQSRRQSCYDLIARSTNRFALYS